MGEIFVGKWKLTTSEHFDEYMKALDVGFALRNLAKMATPVQDIKLEGDEWTITTTTTFKTHEIKFKMGQEFDEETADGRKVKSTVTLDGGKMTHTQKGAPMDTTMVREITDNELVMVCTAGDIVCTRKYAKQDS